MNVMRRFLEGGAGGSLAGELRAAQSEVMRSRTAMLVWIGIVCMPAFCWAYIYFYDASKLPQAVTIVLAGCGGSLLVRLFLSWGLFDRQPQLGMFLLVAGVYGPVASSVLELARGGGGDFFFTYFLIFFTFVSLYPADLRWLLLTGVGLAASYVVARAARPGPLVWDSRFSNDVVYLIELVFLAAIFNRINVRLFFDERRSRLELKVARDALLGEMAVAQEIQTLLLPRDPRLDGHKVKGVMLPAEEVGGDYYDVILSRHGRQFVAIGDVSGHGVTSGLTMMMARASLLGALEASPNAPLTELYRILNRCLRQNLERMDLRLYMTFTLLEHTGSGCFQFVGRHLPLLVHRAATGEVDEVDTDGVWLGVLDELRDEHLPQGSIELAQGDLLLLYTDGVVEHASGDEMFGFQRLKEVLRACASKGGPGVIDEVMVRLKAHSTLQRDDVTLVVIDHSGLSAVGARP